MGFFNPCGAVFIVAVMVPNVIFAAKCKDSFQNLWKNKTAEIAEQIGRYGCFATMVVDIPGTCLGFKNPKWQLLYIILGTLLTALYCLLWVILWERESIIRAVALSLVPSMLFFCCGILSRSVLLTASAAIFAPSHILISCKNALLKRAE